LEKISAGATEFAGETQTALGGVAGGDETGGCNRTPTLRERPCPFAFLRPRTENSFTDRGTRTGRDRSAGQSNRGSDRGSDWCRMKTIKRPVIPNAVRDLTQAAGSHKKVCVIQLPGERSFAPLRMTLLVWL